MFKVEYLQTKQKYETLCLTREDKLSKYNDVIEIQFDLRNTNENIILNLNKKNDELNEFLKKEEELLETQKNELKQIEFKQKEIADIMEVKILYASQMKGIQTELAKYSYELKNKLTLVESQKKSFRSALQELKGNIRVLCRMKKHTDDDVINYQIQQEQTTIIINDSQTDYLGRAKIDKQEFILDRIFPENSTQVDIYKSEIHDIIACVLDGYNVSIFAYGQTGSGKTYSMQGSLEEKGIIPRSLEQIMETITIFKSKGWIYKLELAYLEIYNETIRDLLNDMKLCEIKLDSKGSTITQNLSFFPIASYNEALHYINIAAKRRTEAATAYNEHSSRSHSVFQLKITGQDSFNHKTDSILSLIDLSGSERIEKSQIVQQDRLKETMNINRSLSFLGDVIAALGNKEHIPYRNSKLTMLMKNSLGGNSKTVMLVNISPSLKDTHETINSLRFAQKVNRCRNR